MHIDPNDPDRNYKIERIDGAGNEVTISFSVNLKYRAASFDTDRENTI